MIRLLPITNAGWVSLPTLGVGLAPLAAGMALPLHSDARRASPFGFNVPCFTPGWDISGVAQPSPNISKLAWMLPGGLSLALLAAPG